MYLVSCHNRFTTTLSFLHNYMHTYPVSRHNYPVSRHNYPVNRHNYIRRYMYVCTHLIHRHSCLLFKPNSTVPV